MLAALCVKEPRRRWLSLRRRPPMVQAEIVNTGSGRYFKITAESGKNGQPNWAEVRHVAGREAGRLLIPRGFTPPQDSRITPFQGVELARKLMASAAAALLSIVSINPRLLRIGIYDPQAVMIDLPLQFIPLAADVRVITQRPERFEIQKYNAMQQYGAVLTVTGEITQLSGSMLLLAPDVLPTLSELAVPTKGWVMTARCDASAANKKGILYDYIPKAPHNLMSAAPQGCDPVQFLAGLYELSGVREIAAKPPEFIKTCGHTITLRDAAWRLAGLDIGITV